MKDQTLAANFARYGFCRGEISPLYEIIATKLFSASKVRKCSANLQSVRQSRLTRRTHFAHRDAISVHERIDGDMHARAFFNFSNQRNVVYRVDKSLALAAVRDMRKDKNVLEKGL